MKSETLDKRVVVPVDIDDLKQDLQNIRRKRTGEKVTTLEAEDSPKPHVTDENKTRERLMEKICNDQPVFPKPTKAYSHLPKKDQEDIKASLDATHSWLDGEENITEDASVYDPILLEKWKKHVEKVNKWIEEHKAFPAPIAKALLLDDYGTSVNVEKLSPKEKQFKAITDKMFATFQKKNKDYGSSFDELYDEFGMTSALLRLKDKYNRLKAINANGEIQVKDESVEDTLLDMANYAILTVLKLRTDKK